MLISDGRITESILDMLDRLQKRSDIPQDAIFDLSVAAMLLRHSRHMHLSDGNGMRSYCRSVVELLEEMKMRVMAPGVASHSVLQLLEAAAAEADGIALSPLSGGKLKQAFIGFLIRLEQICGQIVDQGPDIGVPLFAGSTERLLAIHNAFPLSGDDPGAGEQDVSSGEPLTTANLTAYVRKQLADPTAQVTAVRTLTGGFGKETTLFTVSGHTMTADLVMRRDSPIDACGGLDCHTADKEFPLLKALYTRGFLVAEPLWHTDESPIIKGPAFTVMRRSPGATIGGATGGEGRVSAEQQRTLARITASLHALPLLSELGHMPAFVPAMWKASAADSARSYISQWYRHYSNSSHLPVPALHGLFNWLLVNVPPGDDSCGLVHGDIGFHNLLFDKGRLSAVLDWEFAHIGDPAEDIGYIRSVMGHQLDWPAFVAEYGNAGGSIPTEQRVRFYEIWSHVRNAASTALFAGHFEAGRLRHIKYGMIVYGYLPHFISRAQVIVRDYEKYGGDSADRVH